MFKSGTQAAELKQTSEHQHFEFIVYQQGCHHDESVCWLMGTPSQPLAKLVIMKQKHALNEESKDVEQVDHAECPQQQVDID